MTLKRFLFTHVVKSPARPIFSVIEFDLQSSHGSNIFGNYPKVVNTESGRFIHTLFYSCFLIYNTLWYGRMVCHGKCTLGMLY